MCAIRRHFVSVGARGKRGDIGCRQPRPVLGLHEECARGWGWQGWGRGELGTVAGGQAGSDEEGMPPGAAVCSPFAIDGVGVIKLGSDALLGWCWWRRRGRSAPFATAVPSYIFRGFDSQGKGVCGSTAFSSADERAIAKSYQPWQCLRPPLKPPQPTHSI